MAPEELVRQPSDASEMAPPPIVPTRERHRDLEQIIRTQPTDLAPYRELATIYRQDSKFVEAIRVLQKALEVQPDDPQLLWDLEESILCRSLSLRREAMRVAAAVGTAEAQREAERAQLDWSCRRVEVCRARLRRDPGQKHLRVVLAESLRDLGEYAEAITELQGVLDDDDESPTAYLLLGQCLQATGEHLAALAAWRAAALRRAVPAPARLRVLAMRAAAELAERLGLAASVDRYRQALQRAQAELQWSE